MTKNMKYHSCCDIISSCTFDDSKKSLLQLEASKYFLRHLFGSAFCPWDCYMVCSIAILNILPPKKMGDSGNDQDFPHPQYHHYGHWSSFNEWECWAIVRVSRAGIGSESWWGECHRSVQFALLPSLPLSLFSPQPPSLVNMPLAFILESSFLVNKFL